MNHHTYEDWLFAHYDRDEEALAPQQAEALREHLGSCEACRLLAHSWEAMEAQLRAEPMLGPEVGFASRWHARLEADRLRTHQRQTMTALVFSSAGVVLLLGILLFLVWPSMRSPNVFLWAGLYRLFTLYAYADAARDFISTLFQTAAGVVPLTWLVIFVGLLSELGVLWIVSYRVLTNPRRITR